MDDRKIISLSFNQDKECFTCSMETGFRIYNVEPLVEKARCDMETVGSVSKCEMLYRSNLVAVVAGGSRPKFMDNVLLIYDDLTKKFVLEITFPLSIRGVRLRKDKIVVALLNMIYVFSFPSPTQKLCTVDTIKNHRGICELSPSPDSDKQLLFFPGQKLGSVQIMDLSYSGVGTSSAPIWIGAHKGELACIAVNKSATKIATASVKGTLIRVWDVVNKAQLVEFRRGSDPATIYSINFSANSEYLCCSSDKGTVHIFAVKNTQLNKRMIMHKARILGVYGNSQWALANFTVPPECACICAFSSHNSVTAICLDGTFHKYVFGQDGMCSREAFDVFLDVCDDEEYLL